MTQDDTPIIEVDDEGFLYINGWYLIMSCDLQDTYGSIQSRPVFEQQ